MKRMNYTIFGMILSICNFLDSNGGCFCNFLDSGGVNFCNFFVSHDGYISGEEVEGV